MSSRGKKKQDEATKAVLKNEVKAVKRISGRTVGIIAAGVILLLGLVGVLLLNASKRPDFTISDLRNNKGLQVFDTNGNIAYELSFNKDKVWVSYDDIPENLRSIKVNVATFDGLTGLFNKKKLNKSASLYLVELAVNEGLANDRMSLFGKLRLARGIDKKFSREEIVEVLYNTMSYGNGVYGLHSARLAYEDCEDFQSLVDNILTKNKYPAKELVSKKVMYLGQDAFCDSLIRELLSDYEKNGVSAENAMKSLLFDGLICNSTLDSQVADKLRNAYETREIFTGTQAGEFIQSAMCIMDFNGGVCAVAGGTQQDTHFNRSGAVERPIGSTVKPFCVYSFGIDLGKIHFSSIIEDEPLVINRNGESRLWPFNADNVLDQNVTIDYALQQSKNTIAVRTIEKIGLDKVYENLEKSYLVDNLTSEDMDLSALGMGYFYNGITLDKLVSCYTPFGSGGIYSTPHYYSKLSNDKGELIMEAYAAHNRIMKESTAFIMNRLLKNVVSKDGALGQEARLEGIEVIGKTGTVAKEEFNACKYFVGATPEYIAGVWIGFDDENEVLDFSNYNSATIIWQAIMRELSCSKRSFDIGQQVVEKSFCMESGLLAKDGCRSISKGWYDVNNLPGECNLH